MNENRKDQNPAQQPRRTPEQGDKDQEDRMPQRQGQQPEKRQQGEDLDREPDEQQ